MSERRRIACPECGQQMRLPSLADGSVAGCRFWSDGKLTTPLQADVPELGRCPACRAVFWTARAEEPPPEEPPPPACDVAAALGVADVLEAIARGLGEAPADEARLRLLLWRAAGDPFRVSAAPCRCSLGCLALAVVAGASALAFEAWGAWVVAGVLGGAGLALALRALRDGVRMARVARAHRERAGLFQTNLLRLLQLLREADPEERLLRAEALRQLGRAEEARALLDEGPWPGHLQPWVAGVRALAEQGDRLPRALAVGRPAGGRS